MQSAVTIIIIMGVAGCGKTTVGQKLVAALVGEGGEGSRWMFLDADDFHPPANIAKMSAGTPLDDADRAPWLAAIHARLETCDKKHTRVVLACSALKVRYRAALTEGFSREKIALVYLEGTREKLLARLGERRGHFMKAAMLDSQLAALEEPCAAEAHRVITADISQSSDEIVAAIRREIIQ